MKKLSIASQCCINTTIENYSQFKLLKYKQQIHLSINYKEFLSIILK
jgi:hypothetical protein